MTMGAVRKMGFTPNYIHRTLYKALKQATADGLVPRNVASLVKAPKHGKKEIHPLNRARARPFSRQPATID